jgi:uncharacterized membrane protein
MTAALIALLAWGFGDFFIQRSIRAIGSYGALFCIGAFGGILLLPFVWGQIPSMFAPDTLLLLTSTLLITTVGALLLFEALKIGKLSVVEPILSTELMITFMISVVFLREAINTLQAILICCVFVGILLVAAHHEHKHWWQWWKKERLIEQGVILAAMGAFFSALINTFTALSSRDTSPLETIWFVHTGLAILSIVVLGYQGKIKSTFRAARVYWRPVLTQSILDNVAWIAYAKAALTIPIGITVGITESYIVLSSFLGIALGKEKLRPHQFWGIGITLVAAITLAIVSS